MQASLPRHQARSLAAPTIKTRFMRRTRGRRMEQFLDTMGIEGGERILDLGGTVSFWNSCPYPLDLTVVNLPGINQDAAAANSPHRVTLVVGDACDLHLEGEPSFDITFSNSVIEHVGPPEKRRALADEARRRAPRYWVQTPSVWFPIEAHCNMPFWWAYPEPVKQAFLRRWRQRLPNWTEMIETTTVVAKGELRDLFPDATIWVERYLGFAKSYVAYKS